MNIEVLFWGAFPEHTQKLPDDDKLKTPIFKNLIDIDGVLFPLTTALSIIYIISVMAILRFIPRDFFSY